MTTHAPALAVDTADTTDRREHWSIAAGAVVAVPFAAWGYQAVASIALLGCVAPMIIATDLRERRIPTRLVHASAVILASAVAVTAAAGDPSRALHAATGLVVVGGAFLGVHLVSPSGMGYGDVRLAALIGTAVAYGTNTSLAVTCAVVAAAASGVSCLIRRQHSAPFAALALPVALATIAIDALSH